MISSYLQVFGRHMASDRLVSGAYKTEYGDTDEINHVMARIEVSHFINVCFMVHTCVVYGYRCVYKQ